MIDWINFWIGFGTGAILTSIVWFLFMTDWKELLEGYDEKLNHTN